jgi:protein involved in polysaccharide export with SLBB domain
VEGKNFPPPRDLAALYQIRCPDILAVRCPICPDVEGSRTVEPSGFVTLAADVQVELAGLSVPEAERVVSRRLGCPATLEVAFYQSQQIFLVDPQGETQRAISYRGPETVVEFLRRCGGLQGAELDTVHVVRAHVADGKQPEVFEVNLAAILLQRDAQTDVRLQPFDRVYISQSKRWRLCSCLPPWMRPLFRRLTGESGCQTNPGRVAAALIGSRHGP